jgi:hypothetical protein
MSSTLLVLSSVALLTVTYGSRQAAFLRCCCVIPNCVELWEFHKKKTDFLQSISLRITFYFSSLSFFFAAVSFVSYHF